MKKLLAGGAALGFAGAGLIAFAVPGSAQEGPDDPEIVELRGSVTPSVVTPDGQVTFASIDPCPAGSDSLIWGLGPQGWLDTLEGEPTAEGEAPVDGNGNWSVVLDAPDAVGNYDVAAVCLTTLDVPEDDFAAAVEAAEGDGKHEGTTTTEPPPNDPEEPGDVIGFYGPLTFTVQVAAAPPATPVVTTPPYTG